MKLAFLLHLLRNEVITYMRELYLECYSGISGDMSVAALLDAGADKEYLLKTLATMPLTGYEVKITRVKKNGIDSCDFNVVLDSGHENHDHDMEYLYGHLNGEGHTHNFENVHSHTHSAHHSHRGLKEIYSIIEQTQLTGNAEKLAKKIFRILAEAEAKAHATDIENVHFHEVGAVDSIVDIVAFAVCFDNLHIDRVYVPGISEGTGTIRCQHGIIPVPVPAVLNITSAYNIELSNANIKGELVTPTGAAIVAAVRTDTALPQHFSIKKTGYGAGKREYELPGVLRAMLIESNSESLDENADLIYKLETDIDDCSSEILGYTMERLYKAGAREVHFLPIYMKKNRPAYELVVICCKEDITTMENIIFEETTTIGIRRCAMKRTILPRKIEKVSTPYGEIDVKVCTLPNGKVKRYPEYETIKSICEAENVPLRDIIGNIGE